MSLLQEGKQFLEQPGERSASCGSGDRDLVAADEDVGRERGFDQLQECVLLTQERHHRLVAGDEDLHLGGGGCHVSRSWGVTPFLLVSRTGPAGPVANILTPHPGASPSTGRRAVVRGDGTPSVRRRHRRSSQDASPRRRCPRPWRAASRPAPRRPASVRARRPGSPASARAPWGRSGRAWAPAGSCRGRPRGGRTPDDLRRDLPGHDLAEDAGAVDHGPSLASDAYERYSRFAGPRGAAPFSPPGSARSSASRSRSDRSSLDRSRGATMWSVT